MHFRLGSVISGACEALFRRKPIAMQLAWILGESLLGRFRPQQNFAESPQEV